MTIYKPGDRLRVPRRSWLFKEWPSIAIVVRAEPNPRPATTPYRGQLLTLHCHDNLVSGFWFGEPIPTTIVGEHWPIPEAR